MKRPLVLSTPAEGDLAEAVNWYDQIRPGLGDDLLLCVEYALGRIQDSPEAFPTVLLDTRRALVRRFPFGVFFRVRPRRIEVEAIFHLRTNPSGLVARRSSG